jgi:hypothetical protein
LAAAAAFTRESWSALTTKKVEDVLISAEASHRRPALPHHGQSFEVDLAALGLSEQG